MKALAYLGTKKLDFVEMPEPKVGANDVLLKIKKVGICGTDLHIYNGGMNVNTPLVMGHEFVGDVAKVGSNVINVKVGDRAVAEHVIGCGKCEYCKNNQKNLCVNPTVIGLHRPGALAEYLLVPSDLVYVLPSELSYDDGVLVEPVSIAVYAIKKSEVQIGDTVSVVGQGPIGLFVDQVAKSLSCDVSGFDINQNRLDFALKNNYIDQAYNSGADFKDLETDIVFEAVGREETAQLSIKLAKRGGKVVILGVFEHNVSVNIMDIVKKELRVMGSWTCLDSFGETILLIKNKKIDTQKLITHRYKFDDAIKAFEDASSYLDNRIKSVIEF